ncbi:MAG TPA: DUF262 domain-containing protein [Amaricoccus sp.]|uniref:DUF262 domain-containing protein n=1 Tax=Amaricoccus sp. TaxID=1872485 RepID=UPI002C193659|nr:DUF262 domain-containing protein [Amaricoccus sp.]HMQ94808.1 DUF262 domain-containing protein [Amaricoccus sp.]HMR52432.1 DUF262 domain-containing protein [Amaricoccus sp.]HMT99412.1 DUF262 domain-containing protein [Amaricoccus sp.]
MTALAHEDAPEHIDDKDVVYSITTFGADFDVDGIISRMDRGDIFIPEFQRNFVWKKPQASRFIESILLGLPVPSIFLYREASQRHLIVDGLQRLTTLRAFSKERWPDSDKVFKLVDVKPKFEGRTLTELSEEDQRRFRDSVLHAMIIMQSSPENDQSSVYHIFDRLNSNGTPLQPQEVRAAIYHGRLQQLLGELNEGDDWRAIFGPKHNRSKDQELILRFLALRFNHQSYQKPMQKFLNGFMEDYRDISVEQSRKWATIFNNTSNLVVRALGNRPFRPQRALNVAIFDAVMVAVSLNASASENAISDAYGKLLHNPSFERATTRATSDETSVESRISLAMEAISAAKSRAV